MSRPEMRKGDASMIAVIVEDIVGNRLEYDDYKSKDFNLFWIDTMV